MNTIPCIECGKNDGIYDNLCERCFKNITKIAYFTDKRREIKYCPVCEKYSIHGKCSNNIIEVIEYIGKQNVKFENEVINRNLQIERYSIEKNNIHVTIRVSGEIKNVIIENNFYFTMKLIKNTCSVCSRKSGNYYESIVQLRFNKKKHKSYLDCILNDIIKLINKISADNRDVFLTKHEILSTGIDLYLSRTKCGLKIAKHLAKQYHTKYYTSSKLIGKKNGLNIYRVTYLVRVSE